MKIKSKKGFTLVEILVVIAIIGILAVVAVPSLFKHIESAKIAALEKDVSAVKHAVESFYISKERYPISADSNVWDKVSDVVLEKDKKYKYPDELEIMSEIENLKFPLGASYQITYLTGATAPTELGYNLYIQINLPEDNISKRGREKLIKDLKIEDEDNLAVLVIKGEYGDY